MLTVITYIFSCKANKSFYCVFIKNLLVENKYVVYCRKKECLNIDFEENNL